MSTPRIAIAGAGLAGLTLARTLIRAGADVVVYERDPSIDSRYAGYRVHINSSGTTALRAALTPELWRIFVAASGTPDGSMMLFDDQLRPGPARDSRDSAGMGRPSEDVPEHMAVCRLSMRYTLFHGIEGHVEFGRRVRGYEELPGGRIRVRFADSPDDLCDMLIAADGVNSAIRAQRLPQMDVVDLGSRHIAAKVPLTEETISRLPAELFCLFSLARAPHSDGLTFGPLLRDDKNSPLFLDMPEVFRREASSDYGLSIFNMVPSQEVTDAELFAMDGRQLQEFVLRRIAGWHPGLREVVRLWDVGTAQALALRSSVPIAPWVSNSVTMVGDSVHAMSSALGIGANTALRDAYELGRRLTSALRQDRSLVSAVADYEQVMREYAFDAVRSSARVGHWVIGHDDLPAAS